MLLKDKRIFIVEDNLTNRSVMQMLLEQAGAEIAFDRWELETIKRLRDFEPVDIILLDLMFPGNINGYEIYDRVREAPGFENVPVVAVSATEPETAIPIVHEKGFVGFISKPIKYGQFVKQVATILNGEEIWDAG